MVDINKAKKKQHYVYKTYLEQWCKKNNQIHSLNIHTSQIDTKNHAKETGIQNFFYKTRVDKEVYDLIVYKYKDFINNAPSPIKEMLNDFIKTIDLFTKITQYQEEKHQNFENLDILHKNFLEEYYGNKIEPIIQISIGEFIASENDFSKIKFDENLYLSLILFTLSQAFRTKSSLTLMSNTVKDIYVKYPEKEVKLTDIQVNTYHKLCAIFDIWKHSIDMNNKKVQFIFFENTSDIDFITSDQPIFINNSSKNNFPYNFEFPLTPRIFVKIVPNNGDKNTIRFQKIILPSKNLIEEINNKIHKNSFTYVYSNDKSTLDSFKVKVP